MSDAHEHDKHAHPEGQGSPGPAPERAEVDLPPASSTPPPGAAAPTPGPEPEAVEDVGSRALSEALRSSFVIVKIIMVLLVIVFLASGVFTVPSQENAIILRFGRPVGVGQDMLLGPGLHWSFPYPIDEKVRIPLGKIQTVTSTAGWYATTPEMEATNTEPPPGPSLNPASDGYTLTADTNIIHVRATLSYRITDPLNYALTFVNASNMVQNALDNALFHTSAQFTVDEALRDNRLAFEEQFRMRVRELVEEQQLGITIEQVYLETRAPRYIADAFLAVSNAEQERQKTNELAIAYANEVRNKAFGQSNAVVNAGRAERTRRIQQMAAEARYFQDMLPHYQSNPELFLARLRTETMRSVLTNAQTEKFFLPQGEDGKPVELRLQLNREPPRPSVRSPYR